MPPTRRSRAGASMSRARSCCRRFSGGGRGTLVVHRPVRARDHARGGTSIRQLELAVADATALSFPDASFDCCACISVLEHIGRGKDARCARGDLARAASRAAMLVLTTDVAAVAADVFSRTRIYGEQRASRRRTACSSSTSTPGGARAACRPRRAGRSRRVSTRSSGDQGSSERFYAPRAVVVRRRPVAPVRVPSQLRTSATRRSCSSESRSGRRLPAAAEARRWRRERGTPGASSSAPRARTARICASRWSRTATRSSAPSARSDEARMPNLEVGSRADRGSCAWTSGDLERVERLLRRDRARRGLQLRLGVVRARCVERSRADGASSERSRVAGSSRRSGRRTRRRPLLPGLVGLGLRSAGGGAAGRGDAVLRPSSRTGLRRRSATS